MGYAEFPPLDRQSAAPDANPGRQDVRQLALGVLVASKIIQKPRDQEEDPQNPAKLRLACIPPPWCVWPLPVSSEVKAHAMAPSARFLGAPLAALAAAGISEDQAQTEAISANPELVYEAMRKVRDCGGYIYGGMWSLAKFAFNAGVDTADLQRLFEWAIDELSIKNYQSLKNYLLGLDKPVLRIHSKREAKKLVTGLEGPDPKSSKSAWNKLAHPSFFTFTRSHEGPVTSESIGEIRVFENVTQHFYREGEKQAGKAQFCDLEPSKVTVALAVGQILRFSQLIGDPEQKMYNPEGIDLLKGWLWSLSDRERRLARHLLLSPGDRKGYRYLLEYAHAATILGCKVVNDKRYRHRATKDLKVTAQKLLGAIQTLPLANVCIYLRAAISSLGVEIQALPFCAPEDELQSVRGEGSLFPESEIDLPESATDLPETVTGTCEHLPQSATNLPETVTNLPQSATNLPETVTNLPQSATNLPETVTGMYPTATFSYSYVHPILIIGSNKELHNQFVSLNSSTPHPSPEARRNEQTDERTNTQGEGLDSKSVPEPTRCSASTKRIEAPRGQQVQEPKPAQKAVPSGEGWSTLQEWLDTSSPRQPWPQQLGEALLDLGKLAPLQLDKIQRMSPFSTEATWAILQAVLKDCRKLNVPGILYNALLMAEKARPYLLYAGPVLRECGWCAEVTDGTYGEPYARTILSRKLAKTGYQRMPLSRQEVLDAKERIRQEELARASSPEQDDAWSLGEGEDGSDCTFEDSTEVLENPTEEAAAVAPAEPEITELPAHIRLELAGVARQVDGLQEQRRVMTRAALALPNSAAMLQTKEYLASQAALKCCLDQVQVTLNFWGGRLRKPGGCGSLGFGIGSQTAERDLLELLRSLA